MLKNKEYDVTEFGQIFEEIGFDYEHRYTPTINKYYDKTIINFYKTSFTSDGICTRKGNTYTFDPKLFWKIEMVAKLLIGDPTQEVLYGR